MLLVASVPWTHACVHIATTITRLQRADNTFLQFCCCLNQGQFLCCDNNVVDWVQSLDWQHFYVLIFIVFIWIYVQAVSDICLFHGDYLGVNMLLDMEVNRYIYKMSKCSLCTITLELWYFAFVKVNTILCFRLETTTTNIIIIRYLSEHQ